MKKFYMSKTFTMYTPESIENGDSSDNGFDYEEREFDSLYEMAKEIRDAGATHSSGSQVNVHNWYHNEAYTVNYTTGEQQEDAFHPKELTLGEAIRLAFMINLPHAVFSALEKDEPC